MSSNHLTQIAQAVEAIFTVAGSKVHNASETASKFDLNIPINGLQEIYTACQTLRPFLDYVILNIKFSFDRITATFVYRKDDRLTKAYWNEDEDLSPAELNGEAIDVLIKLIEDVQYKNAELLLDDFHQRLSVLNSSDVPLTISLYVHVDKKYWMKAVDFPAGTNCLIFLLAEKLKNLLDKKCFAELDSLWNPDKCYRQIILLGNVSGSAESDWLKIAGLDKWHAELVTTLDATSYRTKVIAAQSFSSDEINWEFQKSNSTPHLFYADNSTLNPPDIFDVIQSCCVQACIGYLSNRMTKSGGKYQAEFQGYRKIPVELVTTHAHKPSLVKNLFALFLWSYENSSSDKLNISRQIICYQLGDDCASNNEVLVNRAADVLEAAKGNFQYYLRKSVESYFEKRLKVVEFIQKFSDEIGGVITKISSDFIGDLYKTVGTILGVVLASLVSPPSSAAIIFWTSVLYFIYILIIFFYSLGMSYIRYWTSAKMLSNSFNELSSIMLQDEMSKLKKGTYEKAVWTFRVFFFLTSSAYAILGVIAYLVFTQFL
jgi:hypothetical protein